jgi:hypothetical protein
MDNIFYAIFIINYPLSIKDAASNTTPPQTFSEVRGIFISIIRVARVYLWRLLFFHGFSQINTD